MPDIMFILFECLWFFAMAGFAVFGCCLIVLGLLARRVDPAAKPLSIIAFGLALLAGGIGGACFAANTHLVIYGPLAPTARCTLAVVEHGVTHYVNATAHHWLNMADSVCGAVFTLTWILYFIKVLSIDELNRFWGKLNKKKTGGKIGAPDSPPINQKL